MQVNKRDKATLWPIIKAEVKEGTEIHSDEWSAYRGLERAGYIHRTVNHKKFFVDPVSGAHTQSIESLWRIVKTRYGIKVCGATSLLESKLIEEWWRGLNKDTLWAAFFRDMKITFGPHD